MASDAEGTGAGPQFLCREPWESYYILRRGIMPCCYGATPIAPMSEWRTAWNSPVLQEMRAFLARGELSPYCLKSPTCPIVQRHANQAAASSPVCEPLLPVQPHPLVLRLINRLLGRVPAKLYRRLVR